MESLLVRSVVDDLVENLEKRDEPTEVSAIVDTLEVVLVMTLCVFEIVSGVVDVAEYEAELEIAVFVNGVPVVTSEVLSDLAVVILSVIAGVELIPGFEVPLDKDVGDADVDGLYLVVVNVDNADVVLIDVASDDVILMCVDLVECDIGDVMGLLLSVGVNVYCLDVKWLVVFSVLTVVTGDCVIFIPPATLAPS